MAKEVIVALDFASSNETMEFLNNFDKPIYVKVGMELFYSEGISIIEKIKERKHKIFLDLKLHDIPNTVTKALMALKKLDIDMINVHCAGGFKMMEQAAKVFENTNTKIIAVTQLTSTSSQMLNEELLIANKMEDVVLSYAKLAYKAKLDGVVCSALEASILHEKISSNFLTICPGIRLSDNHDDQVRVTTPKMANKLTCDYIVVGRPITQASNPYLVYQEIMKDFKGEL